MTVAAPSQLSADAGGLLAGLGGNAVDAAVAAMLVAMVTEPGVCSIGGGGFVTVWGEDDPLTIDGYMEMPGRGLDADAFGGGYKEVTMEYGGGITTQVGVGTVATPGGLRGLDEAVQRFGVAPWKDVMGPAIDAARGFPLSQSSAHYLTFAHDAIFGQEEAGYRALGNGDEPKRAGEEVVIPGLADALEALAAEGVGLFYRGEMARAMVDLMQREGGIVTMEDLAGYQVVDRSSVTTDYGGWTIATNPAPAVGGIVLAAMLELLAQGKPFVDVQQAVLGYRVRRIDDAADRSIPMSELLGTARAGDLGALLGSPSTVHVSASDTTGLGCAITMSAGYSAGVTVPGTGIWLNNSLGEIELNRRGYHATAVGERLVSNMAPSVARTQRGDTVAIGSPGADRITTALAAVLRNLVAGMPLQAAVDDPRLHVEFAEQGMQVAAEPGADVDGTKLPVRWFEGPDMFFGGVGAAMCHADGRLEAAADGRRTGGISHV